MAKPDLAISRVAVAEILYAEDVPAAVAVNEAVELGKLYGTEQSASLSMRSSAKSFRIKANS